MMVFSVLAPEWAMLPELYKFHHSINDERSYETFCHDLQHLIELTLQKNPMASSECTSAEEDSNNPCSETLTRKLRPDALRLAYT
jgi:hypothetical protein